MRYRLLGQTGFYVLEICLGTMSYGGKGIWDNIAATRVQLTDEDQRLLATQGQYRAKPPVKE
ncbi:MAG: hypothetical protein ACLQJ0_07505 [Steroidobacteraceae bacterium]|jgi:aryl-alcohol dehydrogenase-like predicted oxidoreductase